MTEEIPSICPRCDCEALDTESLVGDAVCQECGRVFEAPFDEGSETRSEEVQVGGQSDAEAVGDSPEQAWDDAVSIRDASDQVLIDTLSAMDSAATKLLMNPSCRTRAAELVTHSWEENVMHGRTQEAVVGACVYTACRECESPRPADIIGEVVSTSAAKIFDVVQVLSSELGITIDPVGPADYLKFLQKHTGVGDETVKMAERRLSTYDGNTANPAGTAIAALYVVTDGVVTFAEAGEIVGLTKETVWKQAECLREESR